MEFRVTWHRSESRREPSGRARVWPWVLPLAIIQIGMGVVLWRHIRAEPAPEETSEASSDYQEYAGDPDTVMLYTNPVNVTISRDHGTDRARIVVCQGNCQYEYETCVPGPEETPWVDRVRQGVGWKGGYLFVMSVTEANFWRSSMDNVLKLQDGRLMEVGTMARDRQESAEMLGPGYHHGYFHDLVDLFEGEVGHFGSKGVGWLMAMREEHGRFVADLPRTWAENQKTIKANEDDGSRRLQAGDQDGLLRDELMARFGENVLIAAYCGRTNDAVRFWQKVRTVMPLSERKRLAAMESRIVPGRIPCYAHP